MFELGGYCNQKEDGLHDDPEDCENFIICFADRTFRTKCAYGTLWNHITKECDFPEKGIYIKLIQFEFMSTFKIKNTVMPNTMASYFFSFLASNNFNRP